MALSFPTFRISTLTLACLTASSASRAQTEVQGWYSMTAGNGEWVNHLAHDFNASRKDDKIAPMFKSSNDESMTATVAASRASNAPTILQMFRVGTATMMAS